MLDEALVQEILPHYKEVFGSDEWWANEKFKWQAVKTFQDHWNLEADDFAGMLRQALSGTQNLLVSHKRYPRRMIIKFAERSPDVVREMFRELFDESRDVFARMYRFKERAAELRELHPSGTTRLHYQNENAQTIYLWLHYPDRYFPYRWSLMRHAAQRFDSELHFKRGAYEQNIRNYILLGQEITDILRADSDLRNILASRIDATCYSDPELKTLTSDFVFYLDTAAPERERADTGLSVDFDPGLSTQDWLDLLDDENIFTLPALEVMKRMLDIGGEATCTQLANKYGKSFAFYSRQSSSLAQRIAEAEEIDQPAGENAKKRWWPILYTGRPADSEEEGVFIWKLHDNLVEALKQVNLEDVPLYSSQILDQEKHAGPVENGVRHWWLSANPKIWTFAAHPLGEEQWYSLRNENGNKRRVYQNFLDAKPGDWIIGYESSPHQEVTALGRITREQDGENLYFEKVENLVDPIPQAELKMLPELEDMEFFRSPQGSLFKLTENEYQTILDAIREKNPIVDRENPLYSREDFLSDVFMSPERYDSLVGVLRHKKNLILQGAPGVGKTFAAKRLAYSIMGERDDSRIEFIQFHQNYSYEEFIMGYRPSGDTFELRKGIFYEFCKKAENAPELEFFFIIDEINRGNLSRIFGELLMLIENDYRGERATLAYNGETFAVPPNVHIIGMMNTADRSLAMIDYALRRRFSFFEMHPGFSTQGFKEHINNENCEALNRVIQVVEALNTEITQDPSLGRGFQIGHSYFIRNAKDQLIEDWIEAVVDYDILPMLEEYWFDDNQKLEKWENELRSVLR